MTDEAADLWETHAGWWQQGFTDGADPEYVEQILPLAARWLDGAAEVLDIGCGEGQVARLAAAGGRGGGASAGDGARGANARPARVVGVDPTDAQIAEAARGGGGVIYAGATRVVGVDPTAAQIVEAARRGGGVLYARSGAAAVPLRSDSFDAVVACLVFEHIEAVDEAIGEVARVLRPGGRFVFFLNHPLLQTPNSGWIDDQMLDPPEQYWRIGPYLIEDHSLEEVEKDVFIPFIHRPLSRYVNALTAAGLRLVHMDEPAPPPGFLARAAEYVAAATIPRLLLLVCERA